LMISFRRGSDFVFERERNALRLTNWQRMTYVGCICV
jgi:hypothetical protein